jgi:hypothetical protein
MATDPKSYIAPEPESGLKQVVTARALALGALCSAFVGWGGHFTRHISHTTKMTQDHLPWGVVVPVFLIAVVLNKTLEKIRPSWALTRAEILVTTGMALIASAIPSYFMGYVIANTAAPFYFATTENRWAADLHPHLPDWAVIKDPTAIRWFFEGLPAGADIPWDVWIVPLFWRLSQVAAIGVFCLCAVSILRKQWVEHERLTFPLMALPLAMAEREPKGAFPVGFLNQPIFWVGFALAAFQTIWGIVGYFAPLFPELPRDFGELNFGRDFPGVHTRLYPVIVGASYFIELEVLTSILFFQVLLILEMGVLNRIGAEIGPTQAVATSRFEDWQGFGALCVIVPWSLWIAREHLRNVLRKALHDAPDVDDSHEVLSYRAALIGLVCSGFFVIAWCVASGMSIFVASIFLAIVVLIWLGITRVTIEGGVISARMLRGQPVMLHLVGPENISPAGLAAFSLTEAWHKDIKTILMADLANANRLFQGYTGDRRRLLTAVLTAFGTVVITSAFYQVVSSYQTGAFNYGGIYGEYIQGVFDTAAGHIRDPFKLKREQMLWSLLGVVTSGLTLILRYAFPGWPLHPIGFVAATAHPTNRRNTLPVFMAWLVKLIILRTGGISLYQKTKPLFFGLMLGYFVGIFLSFVVDVIWFPGQGHSQSLY